MTPSDFGNLLMISMPGWLQRRRMSRDVVVTAVVCTLLAVSQSVNVYAFTQGRPTGTWAFAFALMLPTWVLVGACTPVIMWLARTYSFAPQDRARSTTIHFVSAIVFALGHITAITVNRLLLPPAVPAVDRFAHVFGTTMAHLFYQDVLVYVALLAVYLALHYSDLRTQLVEARLTALRVQLNPHFFFNTLNAMSTLALEGRRHDVVEMIGRLGDLLRTALDGDAQEVRLSAELAFVDDYLAIQRVRFGDRFNVHKAIASETLDALVPSLVLQPILENAIEYGIATDPGSTSVNIAISRRGDDLLVEVADTGPGFAVGVRKEGIGLANTRARLQELYGTRCRFEYGNLPAGGASVRMSIPFRSATVAAPGWVAGREYALESGERSAARL